MICWRRRSVGKYSRIVRGKLVQQTYTSAPERQLMRAACSREDRAHTQVRRLPPLRIPAPLDLLRSPADLRRSPAELP